MSEMTDRALLRQVRCGDERAFEELFLRHYAGVYGVVLRVTGDPSDAEEVTQDTFLKLHQRPLVDSDDANVRAWLYRVGTNAAFNTIRSRRRRLGWLRRLAGRADARDQDDRDPATIVSELDEAERVRWHLAQISERQRTALVMRSSGMNYAEIAAAIGVKPGSVGTILARAEKAFQKAYDRETPVGGESR
jgi:RNA polymerase sigma-70 factor (ECF subfamily)